MSNTEIRLRKTLTSSSGGGKWEEVPGHEGKYTFVPGIKSSRDVIKDGNIEIGEENPVLDNLIEFMKRQKLVIGISLIGFAAQQAMKELRRANVSEERRAKVDRKGIERGFGVRFGKMNSLHPQQNLTSRRLPHSLSSTIKLQAEIQNDPNRGI